MPELKAKFTADDSQFTQAANRVQAKTLSMGSMLNRVGAGLSLAALGQFIKASVQMASDIKDAADAIDISTDALQAFRQESERAGSTAEKMEQALNRIAQARNEAITDPTGTSGKLFEKLGISLIDLEKMSVADAVVAIGKAMNAAGRDAEVMAAAVDLVGVRSKRMVEAIKAIGAAGVEGSFDKIANPFDKDTIEKMDTFVDNLKEIGTGYKAQVANLLSIVKLGPKTFVEEGEEATSRAARFRKMRAENEAFTRRLTTGERPPEESSIVKDRLAKAAREVTDKMRDKTLSAFSNISDPVAAIGRGAGKDFSYDTLGTLLRIEENTRRIQPTPAPVMR